MMLKHQIFEINFCVNDYVSFFVFVVLLILTHSKLDIMSHSVIDYFAFCEKMLTNC